LFSKQNLFKNIVLSLKKTSTMTSLNNTYLTDKTHEKPSYGIISHKNDNGIGSFIANECKSFHTSS